MILLKEDIKEFKYNKNLFFIDPNKNDQFTLLKGFDLQELLVQLDAFYLSYRKTLGLTNDITFGTEIEYENASKTLVEAYLKTKKELINWNSKHDGSLNSGGEINSPIMNDEINYWKQLKLICDFLKKRKANTSNNAGGHLHIGANVLGEEKESWIRMLEFWIAYEPIIFRFAYGDKINNRSGIGRYAYPMRNELKSRIKRYKKYNSAYEIARDLPSDKYQSINFSHIRTLNENSSGNTIEFRCPNSSTEAIIWQNNINFLSKLLLKARTGKFRQDILEESLYKANNESINFEYYGEIFLNSALELVDTVFDNNLDKVYFLRQYLKSFENQIGSNYAIKAKSFIKR